MHNGVDMFTSRRDKYDKCMYWCRTQEEIDRDDDQITMVAVDRELNQLSYERSPDGTFYAKLVSGLDHRANVVGGSFMFDQTETGLMTEDDVGLLKQNDIIVFEEEVWRVTGISRTQKIRQKQFGRHCAYVTYINIKK